MKIEANPTDKYSGALLTDEMDQILRLYSVYKNQPMSQTIRQALTSLIENEKLTAKKLESSIVDIIVQDWEGQQLVQEGIKDRTMFYGKWAEKLAILPLSAVTHILRLFKNATNKGTASKHSG